MEAPFCKNCGKRHFERVCPELRSKPKTAERFLSAAQEATKIAKGEIKPARVHTDLTMALIQEAREKIKVDSSLTIQPKAILVDKKPKHPRADYQREYMRKWRAKQPKKSDVIAALEARIKVLEGGK